MKEILIAFDIDGTLRNNDVDQSKAPIANEEIRTLLIILSKFKNVKILVWSGGGELYARQVCYNIGISEYVDRYASKGDSDENGMIKPDIAIDDIHECEMGKINLICRQK